MPMASNSFGKRLTITTFGESHGEGIGVVIDGFPSNFEVDLNAIQKQLDRRRPGQSALTTQRVETDRLKVLSGLYNGKSTGAPITFWIENKDHKPTDYDALANVFRPSHADFTWFKKYGHRDPRGGGRTSARETAARVMAGALAQQWLKANKIEIYAYVHQIYKHICPLTIDQIDVKSIETSAVRCPHLPTAQAMEAAILKAKNEGDSLGGVVLTVAKGLPIGLGNPVFDRLEADLAKAMLSINATKGFEIGDGFAAVTLTGIQHNDAMTIDENKNIVFESNHAGGVLGGISTGQPLWFKVAFKPTATIAKPQNTINTALEPMVLEAKGRHDPCVVPRAVPIVEAMTALVIMDHYLTL